jgi:hypothetical protein
VPPAKSLIKELASSLQHDGSSANINRWANYIIRENIKLEHISELILAEEKTAMRFSWMIGGFVDEDSHLVNPLVEYFFSLRHHVKFKSFNRSLAKMFFKCDIPEHLEGEITSELFNWLMDVRSDVSTKSYCLCALHKLSSKHKDLKQEFKIVIEDQLVKNTTTFRKKAEKILESLRD